MKFDFVWFLMTLWFIITKWSCLHILFLIWLSRQERTNSCRNEFKWLHRKKQLLHAVTHFKMYNSVFLEYSTFQRSSSSCEAVVGSKEKNLFCAVSLRTAVSGPAFPYSFLGLGRRVWSFSNVNTAHGWVVSRRLTFFPIRR